MVISVDDFILFCERTIDGMVEAASELDDQQINQAPPLAGANTPYQLVAHALAACGWWTGHMVCGLPSNRDRNAEFAATGSLADLVAAASQTKGTLRDLAPAMGAATRLRFEPQTQTPLKRDWTVGAALIHAYEELAQHRGHLEITVALIRAGS